MGKKIYCYIDESGQDTKGDLFLIGIVIAADKEKIEIELNKIEQIVGTKLKWRKTRHERRLNYLKEIISRSIFKNSIFILKFPESGKAYVELTILASARILKKYSDKNNKIIITVDGLRKNEVRKFATDLRKLGIKISKIRGAKEETTSFLRLADMVLGLFRDSIENKNYAQKLVKELISKEILKIN